MLIVYVFKLLRRIYKKGGFTLLHSNNITIWIISCQIITFSSAKVYYINTLQYVRLTSDYLLIIKKMCHTASVAHLYSGRTNVLQCNCRVGLASPNHSASVAKIKVKYSLS